MVLDPEDFVRYARDRGAFTADIETTGLDLFADHLIGIAFRCRGEKAYYATKTAADRMRLLQLLQPLFGDPNVMWANHNICFDYERLHLGGLKIRNKLFCTQVASWLLNEDRPFGQGKDGKSQQYGLGKLVFEHFGRVMTGRKETKEMGNLFGPSMGQYATEDAWEAWELADFYQQELQDAGLLHLLEDIEMPIIPLLADVHTTGMLLDGAKLKQLHYVYQANCDRIYARMRSFLGHEFDVHRPEAMSRLLFEQGIPDYKVDKNGKLIDDSQPVQFVVLPTDHPDNTISWTKEKRGKPSQPATKTPELEFWDQDYGFIYDLIDWRHNRQLINGFCIEMRALARNSHDGRARFRLVQTGTKIGRFAGKGPPNPQAFPRPDEDADDKDWKQNSIRGAIIAAPGNLIGRCDLCLTGETLVETIHGQKPISEIKKGDRVFAFRASDEKVWWGAVEATLQTPPQEVWEVELDNGEIIRGSGAHKLILRNGDRVRIDALVAGNRLLPFKRTSGLDGRVLLYSKSAFDYTKEHIIVADAAYGPRPDGYDVHHKDDNYRNNDPANLEYKESSRHKSEHSKAQYKAQDHDIRVAALRVGLKRRRSYAGSGNPNFGRRDGETVACAVCGKESYRYRSQVVGRGFCSAACYRARRRIAPASSCLYCNQPFYPRRSVNKYCSRQCGARGRRDGLNHKVVAIRRTGLFEPMFDIQVSGDHNFALAAGIISSNSQIELRIMAFLSQDPAMLEVYRSNGVCAHTCDMFKGKGKCVHTDIHTRTSEALHVERTKAKNLNFLNCYRGAAKRARSYAKLKTVAESQAFIDQWFATYPGVRRYHDHVEWTLPEDGWIMTSSTGRLRRLKREAQLNDYRAVTQGIQFADSGLAQDLMKIGMRDWWRAKEARAEEDPRWNDVHALLQVHDELVQEGPNGVIQESVKLLQECFAKSDRGALGVPIKSEGGCGPSWVLAG